ncbi:MAG TPA: type II toxin-antitoxin system VapC family toxin [Chloroflexia bacterium]|nr:type II toxin-antitoxin system VapC family toxin [Chloroflexia bacterium]
MNGSYLLNTNIVVAFFRLQASIQNRLAQASLVYVSSIVLGELYFGAYKSNLQQRNMAQIDTFVTNSNVLYCDIDTARQYGLIKQQLQDKDRPIPDNDIWIAAVALQHDLTLATRDAHFRAVDNLIYEIW